MTSALCSTNGRISSPGAELVADLLHRRQQHVVERRHGAELLDGGVDLRLDPVALAPQDVPVQRLLGLHPGGRVGDLGLLARGALRLVVGDEALERVLAPVEDQVVGERALLLVDLAVGRDVVRVDHREVQAGLDAVVQEDRVQHRAGGHADAEGDVGDAERGLHAGQLGLDQPDALDRLDGRRPPLLVARGQREGERVEDQQLGIHPVLVADQLLDAAGDLELALARLGHADLVDRQRDQRGTVLHGDRHDAVELLAARLEVDRVDDRPAGDLVERGGDDLRLGRVDLDRRGLRERDLLGHAAHLLVLVLALGQRDAEVEHVGAALDLVLGDLEQAVVIVAQQQLLGLARALGVDALAHDRGRGLLDERRRRDHRGDVRWARGRARSDRQLRAALVDSADVVGRRSAAAADDRDAVALDELAEAVGERAGLLGEDRLAVAALMGDAGVRDAVHRQGAVLAEEAHRVAHVLRAG
jgi:hypothetical protein